jgi:hypothetical protein
MTELLDLAIAAHGGWDRWRRLEKLTAHISVGGGIWPLKGWPNVYADTRIVIDPHRQHAEYPLFVEAGRRGVFEPDRTSIVTDAGEVIEERAAPRQAFAGHGRATPWDAQNVLYFGGYAMWTYLTTPFLLRLPGFRTEEVEPWNEDGETWRRLKATFPKDVHSHSAEQTFYFDASGILRRHDYSVDILGGTSSAHYVGDPKDVGGIVFPTTRRVYTKGPDNRPLLDSVVLAIDIKSIEAV